MRICHVVNVLSDTTMAGDLVQEQASLESVEHVDVVCWRPVEIELDVDSVSVHSLGSLGSVEKLRLLRSFVSRCDVVHTHHTRSGAAAKVLASGTDTQVVVTEHNNHEGYALPRLLVDSTTNVLADSVVCVSDSVRDSLRWWERTLLDDERIHTVYNGIDPKRIESAKEIDWSLTDEVDIQDDAVVVSSAGMLVEQKAHHVLIDAVDEVNELVDQPVELVISGDGDRREQLEAQIEESSHPERMHLLGFLNHREQVYKMMHESDIYAMPSSWEGFCVAALEAMATGTACVFSDIDPFERYFSEVALFHEVDDSEKLAERLYSLIEDGEMRVKIGDKARSFVANNYTMSSTAAHYVEIYNELV